MNFNSAFYKILRCLLAVYIFGQSTAIYAQRTAPFTPKNAPWIGATIDQGPCTGGGQGYGPWDYTKSDERKQIPVVESFHFTPDVENHIHGTSGTLPGDLDYTLRAVPNHHRALLSVIQYQLKLNSKLWPNISGRLLSPVECYLQRAIHFSPEDAVSVSLLAFYMKKLGHIDQAAALYQKAANLNPNNAKIAYSYSYLLIEQKQYDKALEYAKKAYANGKPPGALKKKLMELGVWK